MDLKGTIQVISIDYRTTVEEEEKIKLLIFLEGHVEVVDLPGKKKTLGFL